MAWLQLILAGFFEIGWPLEFKLSQTRGNALIWIALSVACMAERPVAVACAALHSHRHCLRGVDRHRRRRHFCGGHNPVQRPGHGVAHGLRITHYYRNCWAEAGACVIYAMLRKRDEARVIWLEPRAALRCTAEVAMPMIPPTSSASAGNPATPMLMLK